MTVRTGTPVERLEPGWTVVLAGGERLPADEVVLAADPAARPRGGRRVGRARGAGPPAGRRPGDGPHHRAVRGQSAVDGPGRRRAGGRSFTGVSREATLDSVTLYHRLERGARRVGGAPPAAAVVELHAYAAPDGDRRAASWAPGCGRSWRGCGRRPPALSIVDAGTSGSGHDAPAFDVDSDATRPGVVTDAAGLHLAGDWVRMPFPAALMERAARLGGARRQRDPRAACRESAGVFSVPPRGLLARRG